VQEGLLLKDTKRGIQCGERVFEMPGGICAPERLPRAQSVLSTLAAWLPKGPLRKLSILPPGI
jgi:hypothetical protein